MLNQISNAESPRRASLLVSHEHSAEITRVVRALDEALIEEDLVQILAQFERAIVLFNRARRWRGGLRLARRVYAVVQTQEGFDATPYARTVAQFAYNDALEFQAARVWGAAEELLREAAALFELCGDTFGLLNSEFERGRVLQARGEHTRAAECFRAIIARACEFNDEGRLARAEFQLAQIAQARGQASSAVGLYLDALTSAEQANDGALIVAALHQLGTLAHARGDAETARDWFQAALTRAKESNNRQGIADALHQLGMLAQVRGEWERAEEFYRASLESAASLDPYTRAPTLYQLAQCAQKRGDLLAAMHYCAESLSIVQAQGDLEGIARVRKLQSQFVAA